MSIMLMGLQKFLVCAVEVLVTQGCQRWLYHLGVQKLRVNSN